MMKQSAFSTDEFAASVIATFKEKYPDEMQNIELPDGLPQQEQMKCILDYCVKEGYMLLDLLEKVPG